IGRANKYIDETTPWILAKDDANKPRLETVLYNLLETIRICSSLLSAFMPSAMPKVWEQLGVSVDDTSYEASVWNDGFDYTVKKGDIIFPRFDIEKELG
ncbi:MAG: methionine--tRNA ligase, partial [Oscillospiraceae bacterium]|nr:methionine--tRNA ligase [Oscillospiraceae bacterium]